jgi:hypothetical protein
MARKKRSRSAADIVADQQAVELPSREALSLVFGAVPAPAAAVVAADAAAESAEEAVEQVADAVESA